MSEIEITPTPPDHPIGTYPRPAPTFQSILAPRGQDLMPLPTTAEIRSFLEEYMANRHARIQEQHGDLLDREVPRPWPLHLIEEVALPDGREFLRLHDGRRFQILRWHYATGALRPIGWP